MSQHEAIKQFVQKELTKKTGLISLEIREMKEDIQWIKKKITQHKKTMEKLRQRIEHLEREQAAEPDVTDFGV